MRNLVVFLCLSLAVSSCASPTPTPKPTATSTPTPTTPPTETSDLATLRDLAFSYWEAFNSYDADRVLSYLYADYQAEREEKIRSDIGRIKTFRVKLGVSEKSPPMLVSPTEGEMFLNMKEPIGTRTIRMAFLKTGGEWKINYAEEVP
jgi:hypothetical protein